MTYLYVTKLYVTIIGLDNDFSPARRKLLSEAVLDYC